jgi:hypothetical protein
MRIFELINVPKKAGGIDLIWYDGILKLDKNNHICLPVSRHCEFFPLLEDEQGFQCFLFCGQGGQWYYGGDNGNRTAFLVKIDDTTATCFLKEGERSFFLALKPKCIEEAEQKVNKVSSILKQRVICLNMGVKFKTAAYLMAEAVKEHRGYAGSFYFRGIRINGFGNTPENLFFSGIIMTGEFGEILLSTNENLCLIHISEFPLGPREQIVKEAIKEF